jgi:hypothetical protein
MDDANPSPRTHPIIEGLFTDPMITVPVIATKHNVSYPTAKADIERLVDAGVLRAIPDFHPKTYYQPAIMVAAYGSPEELENS